jgi:hypothetical protein
VSQITGTVARVEWSYYVAATVNGYTVWRDKDTRQWFASGTIVDADAFKLSRRPLMFVAPFKGGAWRWTITGDAPTGRGPFTARLAPPFEVGQPHEIELVR